MVNITKYFSIDYLTTHHIQDKVSDANTNIYNRFKDKDIVLNEGEFLIVPKGVEHCPKAEEEAHIMLLEPKSTLNTGDVINEKTVEKLEWI